MKAGRLRHGMLLWGLGLYGGGLGLAVGLGLLWPSGFGLSWTGERPLLRDVGLGLGVGLILVGLSWAVSGISARGRRMAFRIGSLVRQSLYRGPIPDAPTVPIVSWIAGLALAAGLAEEALFRGTLWSLCETIAGPWAALCVTSLAFGAAHGMFRGPLLAWSLFATASGLVLGGLRLFTGGLVAPVVTHVLIDAVNVPVVLALSRKAT